MVSAGAESHGLLQIKFTNNEGLVSPLVSGSVSLILKKR